MLEPIHIGDGAYISDEGDGFLITANHHLASMATDSVWIERGDAEKLIILVFSTLTSVFCLR